jgi:23S rRNA (cytidine1920-2'-O)/16S rRNA (cytidine1409-2'-O)-methyltransferase
MPRTRERADRLLVERGLAPTREKAQALILAGQVTSGERRIEKASDMVGLDAPLELLQPMPYVSRGGIKLAHALDRFAVSPQGRRCLDIGASTGGFTDCLLQRGASHVTCVDVGEGQLDWGLRNDARVSVLEGVNARQLEPSQVGEPPSVVVADVAFISLDKIIPAVRRCAPAAELVVLVKPQFEVGRERVGKGGVVRDPDAWLDAMRGVARALEASGCEVVAATASPIAGPAGNREFLLHARPVPSPATVPDALLAAAVAEALGRA